MNIIDNCILAKKQGIINRLNKIKKNDVIVDSNVNKNDVLSFNRDGLSIKAKNKENAKKYKNDLNAILNDFYSKNCDVDYSNKEDNKLDNILENLNNNDCDSNKNKEKINKKELDKFKNAKIIDSFSKKKNDNDYITINEIRKNSNFKENNSIIKLDGLIILKNNKVRNLLDLLSLKNNQKTLYEEYLEKNDKFNENNKEINNSELFNILNSNKELNFRNNAINHSISLNKLSENLTDEFEIKNEKVALSQQNELTENFRIHKKINSMFNTNNDLDDLTKFNDSNPIYLKKGKFKNKMTRNNCQTYNEILNKNDNLVNNIQEPDPNFINFLNNYDVDKEFNEEFVRVINSDIQIKLGTNKTLDVNNLIINTEHSPYQLQDELNNSFSTKKTIVTQGTHVSDIKRRYFENNSCNESVITKKVMYQGDLNNYDQIKSLKILKQKPKYKLESMEVSNKFQEIIDEKRKIFTESIFEIKAKLNLPNFKRINFKQFSKFFIRTSFLSDQKSEEKKSKNLSILLAFLNYDISIFNSSRCIRNAILEVIKEKSINIQNEFLNAYSQVIKDCRSFIKFKENEIYILVKFKFFNIEKVIEKISDIKLKTKIKDSFMYSFTYDYEVNNRQHSNKYSLIISKNVEQNNFWICNEYFTGGENLIYKNPVISLNEDSDYLLNLKIDLKSKYGLTENVNFNPLTITLNGK